MRSSSQRGGTLIAADVRKVEQHAKRLGDPDGYRPHGCPACGCSWLHAHDFRWRRPRGDLEATGEIQIRRFVCTGCEAVWTVLPAFIARHLWRTWTTVGVVAGSGERRRVVVPARTRRRWSARLGTSGRKLVSVLAAAGESLAKVAGNLTRDAPRRGVIEALGGAARLLEIAALIDRLEPGVRVM